MPQPLTSVIIGLPPMPGRSESRVVNKGRTASQNDDISCRGIHRTVALPGQTGSPYVRGNLSVARAVGVTSPELPRDISTAFIE